MKILEMLKKIRPDSDFELSDDFINDDLLDSLDIMNLISEIECEFKIEIDILYVVPENFKSIDTISQIIIENGGVIE